VRIVAFYSTSQAAYAASARSGKVPPRVTAFPAGTLAVAFYVGYRHARPSVTRYTVVVHWPAPLGGVRQDGPKSLSFADGGDMVEDPVAAPGLPGIYHVDLQIDGRVVARTSFRVVGQGALSLYAFRLQLSDWADFDLAHPAVRSVRSGQLVYLTWYVEANKAIVRAQVRLTESMTCSGGLHFAKSFAETLTLHHAGGRTNYATGQHFTLLRAARDTCRVTGGVEIDGRSQTQSTTVTVSP
jgi:hypothetical protein